MISQSAEYSLRAVLCLASQKAEATRSNAPAALTTHEIAERTRIPAGYLAKLLQILGRAGIVSSQRGLNGGFTLAIAAQELTLLRVVSAVEVSHRIASCPLHIPEHEPELCPLHRCLDAVAATIEQMLGQTTIAQVLAESTNRCDRSKEFCHAKHECPRN